LKVGEEGGHGKMILYDFLDVGQRMGDKIPNMVFVPLCIGPVFADVIFMTTV
jgi:hypothetical protein